MGRGGYKNFEGTNFGPLQQFPHVSVWRPSNHDIISEDTYLKTSEQKNTLQPGNYIIYMGQAASDLSTNMVSGSVKI